MQYPKYYHNLCTYNLDTKLQYFEDGSYDYNKFPKDIRANSVLERYNRTIKQYLGEKKTCNWVVFLNFINNEILRIKEILGKNENINKPIHGIRIIRLKGQIFLVEPYFYTFSC